MRFEKTALLGALLFAFSANAQDVMVDLSVLDDLDTPYNIDSKPLFPVLDKESIKKKIVKPKVEAKKEIVKPVVKDDTKFKAPIVEIKPLDDDIVVVDVEPVSKPRQPDKATVIYQPKPVEAKPEPVVAEQPKPVEAKPEPVVVEQPKPVEAKPEPVVVEQPKPVEAKPEPVVVEQPKPVEAKPEPVVVEQPKPVEAKPEPVVVPPVVTKDSKLLIEEPKAVTKADNVIKFAEGVDELNEEQKVQISAIVAKYQNGPKNKIAIYSYNLDDGVDSFKKKRISLNRAVEVRSYLLKKGYKNFSIKVININSVSDKLNTVELKEI
ncbi:MAG: hypothetical protein E7004_03360 [Alphaproteobacteria bacterium]|nr:hypothetical protein [Alphaproteobacteria bacterium]